MSALISSLGTFKVFSVGVVATGAAVVSLVLARGPSVESAETPPPAATAPAPLGLVALGYVDAENGVTSLFPTVAGTVGDVSVKENQSVKAGTVLVQLDSRAAELRLRAAEVAVQVAQNSLREAEKLPQQHELQVQAQEGAIKAARQRLEAARVALERKLDLVRADQLNRSESDAAAAAVRELEAVVGVEETKLRQRQLADPAAQVERARAELQARQAERDLARHAVEECQVRAPVDGTVLRVLTSRGDLMGPQSRQPAILFCPQAKRIIRAEVSQEFSNRVAVGQKAIVQDDSRSGETWRGNVTRVSDWFTQRRSVVQEPTQFNDVRTLECIIELDADQAPLRIGQRVRVRMNEALIDP